MVDVPNALLDAISKLPSEFRALNAEEIGKPSTYYSDWNSNVPRFEIGLQRCGQFIFILEELKKFLDAGFERKT